MEDGPSGGGVSSSGGSIQPDPPIPQASASPPTDTADGEPEPDAGDDDRTPWEVLQEELQGIPDWLWIVLAVLVLRWAEENL